MPEERKPVVEVGEAKWQVDRHNRLFLVGTKIHLAYGPGCEPYHVHRESSCHGTFDNLEEAKTWAIHVVGELMEMGIDP